MENEFKHTAKKILGIQKNIYEVLIIAGLPLWFNNGYFNMIEAKRNYFVYVTSIYMLIFIASFLFYVIFIDDISFRFNMIDISIGVFGLGIVVGTLISDNSMVTAFGNDGWGLGSIFWILCILVFYNFSLFKSNVKDILNLTLFISCAVMLIGSMNAVGVDALFMLRKLQAQDVGKYISTIGNVDWYGEYCCIIVPIATVLMLCDVKERKPINRVLCHVTFILGIFSCVVCGSDCAVIGIVISAVYVLIYRLRHRNLEYTGRVLLLTAGIFSVIYFLQKTKGIYYPMGELQMLVVSIPVISLLIFAGLVEIFCSKAKIVRADLIIILIASLLVIMANRHRIGNVWYTYMTFSDSWGNNRGYIWRYAFKIYDKLKIPKKIFGNGLDSFGVLAKELYNNELYVHFGKKLVNAHNNILQLLITTGIVGTLSYYTGFLTAVLRGVRSRKKECTAISLALITYLIQGIFNNFQTVGVVMSITLLAILNYNLKNCTS